MLSKAFKLISSKSKTNLSTIFFLRCYLTSFYPCFCWHRRDRKVYRWWYTRSWTLLSHLDLHWCRKWQGCGEARPAPRHCSAATVSEGELTGPWRLAMSGPSAHPLPNICHSLLLKQMVQPVKTMQLVFVIEIIKVVLKLLHIFWLIFIVNKMKINNNGICWHNRCVTTLTGLEDSCQAVFGLRLVK